MTCGGSPACVCRSRRPSLWDDDEPTHILAKVDCPQLLERLRVVDVDGGTGRVDVELAPVRARWEPHPWPPLELRALGDPSPLEVEGPELVVADLLAEAIAAAPAGREPEVHRL